MRLYATLYVIITSERFAQVLTIKIEKYGNSK